MTYRAYIKKDYKPAVRWVPDQPWYRRGSLFMPVVLLGMLALSLQQYYTRHDADKVDASMAAVPIETPGSPETSIPELYQTLPVEEEAAERTAVVPIAESEELEPKVWQTVSVKPGDNLSIIFDRLGIGPAILYKVMNSGKETKELKALIPGQTLEFLINEDGLQTLAYESSLTERLEINRTESGFESELIITELEKRTKQSSGSIDSSLFLAGQAAGLSDNLIMQLVGIFGWDIDFVLDIRQGDAFKVIYEEHYKDNIKVGEGAILAAEFVNRNTPFRALRYTSPEGDTNYFNEHGVSMRKAFLRTPLKFSRISSGFNLRRKHPVLNRIRAHRGVDYAAPTGTPIKATGDGKVQLAGRKGGYGRTVIIRHGGSRKTLYAHMSKFARNVRTGKRVKQGQIIGYVGKSGLATGPHLHYEFQVNGVHRNPLTVKLPKASSVPAKHMADFKSQTMQILARLTADSANKFALDGKDTQTVLALEDSQSGKAAVH